MKRTMHTNRSKNIKKIKTVKKVKNTKEPVSKVVLNEEQIKTEKKLDEIEEPTIKQSKSSKQNRITKTLKTKKEFRPNMLVQFFNDLYASSVVQDNMNVIFKVLTDRINKSKANIINVLRYPGLEEFIKRYEEKSETKDIENIINRLFDFDLRSCLDILHKYDMKDDTEFVILKQIMVNTNLPEFKKLTANELFETINKYFEEQMYQTKLINSIFPHGRNDGKTEEELNEEEHRVSNGVQQYYIQHVPRYIMDVLKLYVNGESIETIKTKIHNVYISEYDKELKQILSKKEVINAKRLKEVIDIYKISSNDDVETKQKKKMYRQEISEYIKEFSNITRLFENLEKGRLYKSFERKDMNIYVKKYIDAVDRINNFFETVINKFDCNSYKDFVKYFVLSYQLFAEIFQKDGSTKEHRQTFYKHFTKIIDTRKVFRFNDQFRKDLIEYGEKVLEKHPNEYLVFDNMEQFDYQKLYRFLMRLGKNCANSLSNNRISGIVYVGIGIVIIKYVQQEIAKTIFANTKRKELRIYIQ